MKVFMVGLEEDELERIESNTARNAAEWFIELNYTSRGSDEGEYEVYVRDGDVMTQWIVTVEFEWNINAVPVD